MGHYETIKFMFVKNRKYLLETQLKSRLLLIEIISQF